MASSSGKGTCVWTWQDNQWVLTDNCNNGYQCPPKLGKAGTTMTHQELSDHLTAFGRPISAQALSDMADIDSPAQIQVNCE
jgi:hypothetical protein